MNTFDFKKVTTVVAGMIITGFMDGSPIKTEKSEDNVKKHVGAAGDVTFSETNDNTGLITITLKQNSSSLPALVSLAKQKQTFPVSISDNNGGFRAGGTECRIVKTPGAEFGSDVAGVEVQFMIADYDFR